MAAKDLSSSKLKRWKGVRAWGQMCKKKKLFSLLFDTKIGLVAQASDSDAEGRRFETPPDS